MKFVKYIMCFIISFFIAFNVLALQSKNVILYHDNEVMFKQNVNEKVSIASLTKIMTAIVTLENITNLEEKVTLQSSDFAGLLEENLVTAGFKVGDTITYKDLLAGLLLPSGAECAKALERLVSDNFIDLMNQKAKELKMNNTKFANTIGLDDANNYSTVNDVYKMFNYALKNDTFKEIISSKSYTATNGLTFYSTVLKNNPSYLKGGKTGTTDGAGLCLASFANIKGENFILVTTNAPYDKLGSHHLEDANEVYNYIANNYAKQKIIKKGDTVLSLKTKYAKKDKINLKAQHDVEYFLANNYSKKDIKYKYQGIEEVKFNVKKGTKLGTLKVYYQDKLIDTLDITLEEKLQFDVFKFLKDNVIIISIILLFIMILSLRKKRKKK